MRSRLLAAVWVSLVAVAVSVADPIRIVKPGGDKYSIDLSGLRAAAGQGPATFMQTLEKDLVLSGWFAIAAPGRGAIAVDGTCGESGGRLSVPCGVQQRATGRVYFRRNFTGDSLKARLLAHNVADEIVRAVTGRPGISSTRILMIGTRDRAKEVYVCDVDGQNLVQVTRDRVVSSSPKWGPDARSFVYTSYRSGFPDVYLVDLQSGQRSRVSAFPGVNTGADVSPSGGEMVLTLSKDGNPDLYIVGLRGRQLTRLTRTLTITEGSPSWSPDGSRVAYVSNRSGSAQVFTIGRGGGAEQRLTFGGTENVTPDWGADNRIVCSSRRGGKYQIVVVDLATRKETQVTTDYADFESPSWAPDGRHIVCSRTEGYHSDVYILDTQGDPPLRLTRLAGDWYSPDWSPK